MSNNPVALEVDDTCSISTVASKAESSLSAQDSSYSYPLGLLDFTINCGTPGYVSTVKIYHYSPPAYNFTARKFNPNSNSYYALNGSTINNTMVGSSLATLQTYTLKDGSLDDADGIANGIIVDPVGLAVLGASTTVTAPNTGIHNKNNQQLILLAIVTTSALVITARTTKKKLQGNNYKR